MNADKKRSEEFDDERDPDPDWVALAKHETQNTNVHHCVRPRGAQTDGVPLKGGHVNKDAVTDAATES